LNRKTKPEKFSTHACTADRSEGSSHIHEPAWGGDVNKPTNVSNFKGKGHMRLNRASTMRFTNKTKEGERTDG